MALNRAFVGGAGFVLSAMGALGVNQYEWLKLPAACQTAIKQQMADAMIKIACPLAFDDHALAKIILVGGFALALAIAMSPLRDAVDFVLKKIKGGTI